jgi:hypothetical protein
MSTQLEILMKSVEIHLIEVETMEFKEKILKEALKATIERICNSKKMPFFISNKELQNLTIAELKEKIEYLTGRKI